MTRAIFIAVTMLISIQSLHAETITIFESDAIISAGDVYETVVVKGDDTAVNMTGGTVDKVFTMDDSAFNMSGGTITDLSAYDTSDPNIVGGNVGGISFYMQSAAKIAGNTTISYMNLFDSSLVDITGSANVVNCEASNNSTANILGGVLQNVYGIGNVRINLSGGVFSGSIACDPTMMPKPEINIVGYDLEAKPYGGNWNYGEVTGFWNDNSPFTISLGGSYFGRMNDDAYSVVVLHDGVIPSDCVFQPESDLTGDCVVNMTDLAKMADEWLDDGR
jgi:hypothetical protein